MYSLCCVVIIIMELEARLDLLHNSKQAKRLEELRPHLDSLTSQLGEAVAKLGEPEELVYTEETDCLESQMMVCIRTRSVYLISYSLTQLLSLKCNFVSHH